jgi:hypothetical protein
VGVDVGVGAGIGVGAAIWGGVDVGTGVDACDGAGVGGTVGAGVGFGVGVALGAGVGAGVPVKLGVGVGVPTAQLTAMLAEALLLLGSPSPIAFTVAALPMVGQSARFVVRLKAMAFVAPWVMSPNAQLSVPVPTVHSAAC